MPGLVPFFGCVQTLLSDVFSADCIELETANETAWGIIRLKVGRLALKESHRATVNQVRLICEDLPEIPITIASGFARAPQERAIAALPSSPLPGARGRQLFR